MSCSRIPPCTVGSRWSGQCASCPPGCQRYGAVLSVCSFGHCTALCAVHRCWHAAVLMLESAWCRTDVSVFGWDCGHSLSRFGGSAAQIGLRTSHGLWAVCWPIRHTPTSVMGTACMCWTLSGTLAGIGVSVIVHLYQPLSTFHMFQAKFVCIVAQSHWLGAWGAVTRVWLHVCAKPTCLAYAMMVQVLFV